jgi:hypothetical protein
MYVLLALQVYWFALILKVALTLALTGVTEDVRSDDEEDDEAEAEDADSEEEASDSGENLLDLQRLSRDARTADNMV